MQAPKHHGSIVLRLTILGFSIAVGVLAFWLLGYVVQDIDRLEGPNQQVMLDAGLPSELTELRQSLAEQEKGLRNRIKTTEEQRRLTHLAISDSQQTINQLIELQRLSTEKQQELPEDQQTAMTENLQLFLTNQRQAQQLNTELTNLNEQLDNVREQQQANQQAIQLASEPIYEAYREAYERHQWRLAAYKLAILVPLLLLFAWLFVRYAGQSYSKLIDALGGAVALRVILVMHEHFPAAYFKYILVLLSLAICIAVLVRLLRTLAAPSRDWLLRQYREAYATFFCPVCDFPIQRGPLRYAFWTRRSLKKHSLRTGLSPAVTSDAPYTCPSCATTLFEPCDSCGATRHSLLPTCEKCGKEKTVAA